MKDITTRTVLQPFRELFFPKQYEVKCSWCGHAGKINKIPKKPGDILFIWCRSCGKQGALTYDSSRVMI